MKFTPAGPDAEIDRYIGYWEPYATSHEALDRDTDMQAEVRIAAEQLARALKARRSGELVTTYEGLESPRQK
jgi:multimeric flavodoxin WrbA